MKKIHHRRDSIPTMDLKQQYISIKGEIDETISGVLKSGHFILGENVLAFEKEFSNYCHTKFGVGVASGTDALQIALKGCGVGAGDEVITVANTAFPTAIAISHTGAKPVFVDIDEKTYTMDTSKIEGGLSSKTKAILPVHLYGQPADMAPLLEIADQHGLYVIEDACQAHGAEYKGRRVGGFGDGGCFSFYPTKNLGAYGDGGFITTNDEELMERVRLLKDCGQTERYKHVIKGYSSRLDEIQAAILRVKLKRLDGWNEWRRDHAKLYGELLDGEGVTAPVEREDSKHIYYLYVIRSRHRDELRAWLKERGIATDIHFPTPIHLQKAYVDLKLENRSLPVTEGVASQILSLPMYPELEEGEIEMVANAVNDYVTKHCRGGVV